MDQDNKGHFNEKDRREPSKRKKQLTIFNTEVINIVKKGTVDKKNEFIKVL